MRTCCSLLLSAATAAPTPHSDPASPLKIHRAAMRAQQTARCAAVEPSDATRIMSTRQQLQLHRDDKRTIHSSGSVEPRASASASCALDAHQLMRRRTRAECVIRTLSSPPLPSSHRAAAIDAIESESERGLQRFERCSLSVLCVSSQSRLVCASPHRIVAPAPMSNYDPPYTPSGGGGGAPAHDHAVRPHSAKKSAAAGGGEEKTTKGRKPYTITKPRESWTKEEHQLFLDALQLSDKSTHKRACLLLSLKSPRRARVCSAHSSLPLSGARLLCLCCSALLLLSCVS